MTAEMQEMAIKYAEKNESTTDAYDKFNVSLRQEYMADRRRFAEETAKLEELCAKLQNQAERSIREKRSAESELEKITRHLPAESDRLTCALEEIHSRLRASERERNESNHRLEKYTFLILA